MPNDKLTETDVPTRQQPQTEFLSEWREADIICDFFGRIFSQSMLELFDGKQADQQEKDAVLEEWYGGKFGGLHPGRTRD